MKTKQFTCMCTFLSPASPVYNVIGLDLTFIFPNLLPHSRRISIWWKNMSFSSVGENLSRKSKIFFVRFSRWHQDESCPLYWLRDVCGLTARYVECWIKRILIDVKAFNVNLSPLYILQLYLIRFSSCLVALTPIIAGDIK